MFCFKPFNPNIIIIIKPILSNNNLDMNLEKTKDALHFNKRQCAVNIYYVIIYSVFSHYYISL